MPDTDSDGNLVDLHSLIVFDHQTDPVTYAEASQHKKWKSAMDAEISAIERNDTWDLVDLPKGAKRIGVKWV